MLVPGKFAGEGRSVPDGADCEGTKFDFEPDGCARVGRLAVPPPGGGDGAAFVLANEPPLIIRVKGGGAAADIRLDLAVFERSCSCAWI